MDLFSKILVTLSLFLAGRHVHGSRWGLHAQYAGFMGQAAAGPAFAINHRHALELSLGQYATGSANYYQLNGGYLYSPWSIPLERRLSWIPLNLGIFLLWSMNPSRDFVEVPEEYPGSNYYEQRGLRPGLRIGSGISFADRVMEIDFHVMILDSAFIAYSNNDPHIAENFLSSGLGFKSYF